MLVSEKVRLVSDVEQLYTAVDVGPDPAIVLAPGVYRLTEKGPGGPRPHKGRLQLRNDFKLYGLTGDPSAVVIDASQLPASSFSGSPARLGPIMVGFGNAVEWLTVRGTPTAAAGIVADFLPLPPQPVVRAMVRITHVVCLGSSRGIDIRRTASALFPGAIMAEIEDSEFSGLDKQAMRFLNSEIGGAGIIAVMSGNRVHGSPVGCVAINVRSTESSILIQSTGDTFEGNGVGCLIAGASNTSTGNVPAATGNGVVFEAHGSKFINNTGPALNDAGGDTGGLVVFGARTDGDNGASGNTALVRLYSCSFSGNQNAEIEAFGGRATGPSPGVNNVVSNNVSIELYGASQLINVVGTLPSHNNVISVTRFGNRSGLADLDIERRM